MTTYAFNGGKYTVEFDTNANIGTISTINEPKIVARIENNKVTSCKDIRNYTEYYQIQLTKQTYGPEFLKVFMAAKEDFLTKSKNNTLPPITLFK